YHPSSRRNSRIRTLINEITKLSRKMNRKTQKLSRRDIRKAFAPAGARNKYDIAIALASIFPELSPRLPPYRKVWMSESERINIFDALSLALTYYGRPIAPSAQSTSEPQKGS